MEEECSSSSGACSGSDCVKKTKCPRMSTNAADGMISSTSRNGAEGGAAAFSAVNGTDKNSQSKWIKLNVGGQHFVTTSTTLSKYPKSFLFRLCQEDPDLNSDKVV